MALTSAEPGGWLPSTVQSIGEQPSRRPSRSSGSGRGSAFRLLGQRRSRKRVAQSNSEAVFYRLETSPDRGLYRRLVCVEHYPPTWASEPSLTKRRLKEMSRTR